MRWDVFGQFAITDILSKTNLFALSIHRLFFLRPSSRLSLSLTLRFSSLECMLQQQALGKTNQSLTTVVAEGSSPTPSLPPSLPLRTQHNSSLHLGDILLQCEHCSLLRLLRRRLRSRTATDNLQRTGEGRIMASRAAKTQNSKATEDAWHDTQSERRSEGSLPFLLFSGSVSPFLFLVFLIHLPFLSP